MEGQERQTKESFELAPPLRSLVPDWFGFVSFKRISQRLEHLRDGMVGHSYAYECHHLDQRPKCADK